MKYEILPNGKKVLMRWWNVKLNTKHLAFIMRLMVERKNSEEQATLFMPKLTVKELYCIAEIKEAIKDAMVKGEP